MTPVYGQSGNCTNDTPFFSVDLRGQPSGSFTTPDVDREGNCCGSAVNTNCVEFEVYLDPRASGLAFDITSGPQPGGAMFYQINCGTPISVGDSTCANGSGPQLLTICMPGKATNQFTVYSIVAFEETVDISVTEGCSGVISAPLAFDPTSVTYNDITGGGAYNSYLSCLSGCDQTTITPDASAPAFVDYAICGNTNSSNCASAPFCDTVRVNFFPRIQVSIDPTPALICANGNTTLQGQVTGGSGGPYTYIWYDAADGLGNVVGNSDSYVATSAGAYSLEVRNENYPDCSPFISNVDVNDNFAISAGTDQTVCPGTSVSLSGTVQGATGATWSGGGGSFSPNNQTLNATYFPTAAEISAGTVVLTLTSTGNGNCTPGSDQVTIDFFGNLTVSLNGPPTLCNSATSTVSTNVTGGSGNYSYIWDTGETTASVVKPAGTYGVLVTDLTTGCEVKNSLTIVQLSGPTDIELLSNPSTCSLNDGVIGVNNVEDGTAPYSYSLDDITYQSSALFLNLTSGLYTVYAQDANGCKISKTITVADVPGPTDIQYTVSDASCGNPDGVITVNGVSGGQAPYEYSVDGTNFQSGPTFSGLAAGSYSIFTRDVNSCLFSEGFSIIDAGGPDGANVSTVTASCANNDGEISITSVSNGTSPFQYSIDGTAYQTSNTFVGLAASTYSLFVRDVNGCVFSTNTTVLSEAPSGVNANATSASCGLDNGSITVQNVTGGTAPYSYSIDGVQFQTVSSFTGLLPGVYIVSARDDRGCIVTTNITVNNIIGPIDLLFSAQSATCGASNGSLSATGVIGGTSPYQYSIDGTTFQSSTDFINISSGAYVLTVRDANGCEYSVNVAINDTPGPTALTSTVINATCSASNGSIAIGAITGGVSPYTFAIDGGAFQNTSTFSTLNAGSHIVSVRDVNGCILSENIVVPDVSGPSDFNTVMTQSTCGNSDGTISIFSVIGGTGPNQYSIDNGTFQSGLSFIGLASGSYLITVRDSNGCLFSKDVNVSDAGGPSSLTYSVTQANCGQNDGGINITSVVGGAAPYSYSLDGITFQANSSFNSLAAGAYSLTIQDINGCMFVEPFSVPSEGPDSGDIVVTNTTCGNDNGLVTINSVTGGTAPYSYSLDGFTFQSGNVFSGLPVGNLTLHIQDNKGCILTQDVVIIDIPGPQDITISGTNSTCSNSNGTITVDNVNGGTLPYTYAINGGGLQSSPTFTGITAGTHSITVRDANNCNYTGSILIADTPGPSSATIGIAPSDCNQNNGSLEVTSIVDGSAPYSYSIDGSTFQTGTTFTDLSQGSYLLTVQDANNCQLLLTVVVTNNGGPTDLTATVVDETCGNADGSIVIDGVNEGTAPYIYAIGSSNFQNSNVFSSLSVGSYTIYVKDDNDCVYEEVVDVGSNGPSSINTTQTSASCDGQDGTLTVDLVIGGSSPYSFSLDGTNFQSSNSFSGLISGQYNLSVSDGNGCTYSQDVTIGGVGPRSMLDQLNHISCFGANNGSITATATSPNAPISFSIDGTSFQSSGTFIGLSSGLYTILIRDNNGCVTTINDLEITEPEVLIGEISTKTPDPGVANGEAVLTGIAGGTPPYNTTLNGEDMGQETSFRNLSSGSYTITLEDQNQCLLSFEIDLEGEFPEIEIPNGYTPNGDGTNDTWELTDLNQLYPDAEIQVFNRWGQLVFNSKGYTNPWNGKRQGKDLPTAAYYYVIKLNNNIEPLQGTVTIIR